MRLFVWFFYIIFPILSGVVMVVIVYLLDLQLPVQSMPLTINVVSLSPVHGGCTWYNIMW